MLESMALKLTKKQTQFKFKQCETYSHVKVKEMEI